MAFLMGTTGLLVAVFAFHADLPVVIGQALNSTLESEFACLGSRVTFTCETRGSDGIAWASNTYVGPGGVRVGFVAGISSPGEVRTSVSNVDTVATFIEEREEQGMTILKSMLEITPLPEPQNASVTCIHTANVERSTINFQVINTPTTPENVVPVQIQYYGGNCVIHTVWNSPNHNGATQYEVSANGTRMSVDTDVIKTNNGTKISALFTTDCAAYEIGVIASNACGNTSEVSEFTPQTPPHSIAEPEPTARSTSPNGATQVSTGAATTDDREPAVAQSCESYQGAVIGVSVGLVLLCIILFAIIVVGIIFHFKKSNSDGVKEEGTNEEMEVKNVPL